VVARLERVDATGHPAPDADRWQDIYHPTFALNGRFNLREYLLALFGPRAGLFRLFVFIVTPEDLFFNPDIRADPATVSAWQHEGRAILPDVLAKTLFSSAYKVYILLYEFDTVEGHSPELLYGGSVDRDLNATGLHF
jgi:hypothetical protein